MEFEKTETYRRYCFTFWYSFIDSITVVNFHFDYIAFHIGDCRGRHLEILPYNMRPTGIMGTLVSKKTNTQGAQQYLGGK